ncbi:MAG: class I SAM-dependent methyltransferase [Sedimentisphaerales bacterium]
MKNETLKQNVAKFNNDVIANGGYRYTTNASYSSVTANQRMTKATMARIPKGVRSLIDIGCGDGTYTAELARLLPDIEILGVDPAADAIARAKRLAPSVVFTVADLLEPGTLPQRVFDVGIIRGVIHHLPNGPVGIRNAARICKMLIIIEPNGNNPIVKWLEKHSQYHIEHEEQSFTARELDTWCRSAGYGQIQIGYIGFVPMFFPTLLAKIIHFFEPLFECIYPIKKYLSAQIVLTCDAHIQ